MLDFRILGPFEVVDGDRPVALGGRQQRALLAALVLRHGEPVSSDRLTDELWNGRPPPTATKIVQGYVSHLRKKLGDDVLLTRGGGYQFAAAPEQIDAWRFARLAADGRRALSAGDAGGAQQLLSAALALWRGDALADLAYEPFAQEAIARLQEERLTAMEDRIDADLSLGGHHDLAAELHALARQYPNRERLLGQLMLALYRSGRQADALDAFRRGRQWLRDELGLEPGPELRRLEHQILEQDPALDPPARGVRTAALPDPHPKTTSGPRTVRGSHLLVGGAILLLAAAIAAAITQLASGHGPTARVAGNSVAGIGLRTNQVNAAVAVGAQPSAIAYGAGSLWVANVEDQTISRVNPDTLQTLRTIALKQQPTGIAAAGGAVWAVTSNATQDYVSASQIDPRFDTIDRTVRVGNVDPTTAAAVAPQGDDLWVAPFSGDLTRLNSATGDVIQRIDPSSSPAGLAVGGGAEWMTDSEGDNVVRIDQTGLATTIDVGHQPNGIAVGDGAVWVADTGDDAVVKINPGTNAVTATIRVGDDPLGVTAGAGSIWVANSGDGTVSRIDPQTDRVTATIVVGGSPQEIAVADGRAWVTVDAPALSQAKAASGRTLRVVSSYDVDYMDPALAYEPLSGQLLYASCATLLTYPEESGPASTELVPEVAASLPTVSQGGRTYTFTIRKGFEFAPPSNQPVTAQTFKYTIERTLSPIMKNPVVSEFEDIVGAKAYIAGKAKHLAGVVVNGDKLIIHLIVPQADLPMLLAQPFFCSVPMDTPLNPGGVRVIPSAGPYTTASYVPGEGIVLVRNPNYHGDRAHRFARIEVSVNVPSARAVSEVEHGKADYAVDGEITAAEAPGLAARYGPGSPAARHGHQQYFVMPESQLDFYLLNTHQPLFSHRRLRLAVSYAINRDALARLGDMHTTLADRPTDTYLPPGIPGHRDGNVLPLTPDLAKARQLAKGFAGSKVVLFTCDRDACGDQAHVISTDLAAIGLRVVVRTFSVPEIYKLYNLPGEHYDMGLVWWGADYPDPYDFLNLLLEGDSDLPSFRDPAFRRRLSAAARLSGVDRYLVYAKLDQQLVAKAAPWVAFGNSSTHELFSARVGCEVHSQIYGTDLGALCVRKPTGSQRSH